MSETLIQEIPKTNSPDTISPPKREIVLKDSEKEFLKTLDGFDQSVFSNDTKVEVVGVITGVKQVSATTEYDTSEMTAEERFKKLDQLLKSVDMGIKIGERKPTIPPVGDQDNLYARIGVVYKSSEAAETMSALISKKNQTEEEIREIGQLLGYPSTGTDAFLGKTEKIETQEVFNILGQKDFSPLFQPLAMSRENFYQEIDSYGRIIMETMKQYMPKSYRDHIVGQGIPGEYIDYVDGNQK